MLAQGLRLKKNKEFERVFKEGKKKYTDVLGVLCLRNELKHNQFGVIIGTKVSKKATVRNQIKRTIKDFFNCNKQKIKTGFDVVVVVKGGILEINTEEIGKKLEFCLKQLNLYQ